MNRIVTLAVVLATSSVYAPAQLTLAAIFSDHAVLQRDKPIPVWGTAAPGDSITLTLSSKTTAAQTDPTGHWHATLPPLPAGGPFDMTVTGSTTLVIHDLLIGEVWLASGQSNMAFQVSGVLHAPDEIAAANHPQLRVFTEPDNPLAQPTQDLKGEWKVSTPANAGHFTAVGYFFGLSLLNSLHVPVGIVSASVGATPAETWTPLPLLRADPLFSAAAAKDTALMHDFDDDPAKVNAALAAWEKTYGAADPGNTGFAKGYANPNAKLQGWKTITLPARGKTLGITGAAAVWIRRDITLPDHTYTQPAHLDLGPFHESDTVYFNGVKVGGAATGAEPYGRNISYAVSPKLLRAGSNTIAIRLFAHQPANLQMGSPTSALTLSDSADDTKHIQIPLTGEWSFAVEYQKSIPDEAIKSQPHAPTFHPKDLSGTLYNGEIFPLQNYALRGAIWYQGEDNADRYADYPALMNHLITGWRQQFGQDIPFYIEQLVNYDGNRKGWAGLREAQSKIATTIPLTGVSIGIDIGETDQIHPHNKRPVGERLALLARHRVYGEAIEDSGPTLSSIKIYGSKLHIQLMHADGLHATGGPIACFEVAAANKAFAPATATIDGTTITLSSPGVTAPIAVRYAVAQDPEGCNIYNSANLPMGPFRTDDWPLPETAHH